MAIRFETSNPTLLLTTFKQLIRSRHVETWSIDSDGDFFHNPPQWQGRGWLRPVIQADGLWLNFIGNRHLQTTKADYGVIHGRFIESMLTHCDQLFGNAAATAPANEVDTITRSAVAA